MVIYFFVAGISTALAGISQGIDRYYRQVQRKTLPSKLSFLARGTWTPIDFMLLAGLVVFSGLRYYVGTDYGIYTTIYAQLNPQDWVGSLTASPVEFGFTILSLMIRSFTNQASVLFWVTSTITIVPVFVAMKRQSTNFALTVLFFILLASYVTPFNIVRQGMAIALLFWASSFMVKRKVLWVLVVLVATSFHSTAIFAAALQLILYRWKPTLRTFIAALVVTYVVGAVFIKQPAVVNFLSSINGRYATYLDGAGSGLGTYLIAAIFVILVLIAFALPRDPGTERWLGYAALAPIFLILGTSFAVLGRMEGYFSIFFILLLANRIRVSKHRLGFTIVVVVISAIFFAFYVSSFASLVPYRMLP
ncbi:EpsG family protein [Cryobacterium breve]|uniref:EpsG family protein n=1 Tax=Cryobacterium breve TaxID=1259258 RepID=A0ABY7NAR9_9MICO|nr:EpsG family protein [Cryobacterium breve]WBM79374.1 EpsG family protein [Cryobacterium breve]